MNNITRNSGNETNHLASLARPSTALGLSPFSFVVKGHSALDYILVRSWLHLLASILSFACYAIGGRYCAHSCVVSHTVSPLHSSVQSVE